MMIEVKAIAFEIHYGKTVRCTVKVIVFVVKAYNVCLQKLLICNIRFV